MRYLSPQDTAFNGFSNFCSLSNAGDPENLSLTGWQSRWDYRIKRELLGQISWHCLKYLGQEMATLDHAVYSALSSERLLFGGEKYSAGAVQDVPIGILGKHGPRCRQFWGRRMG